MASSRRRFLTTIGAAAAGAGVATAARGTTPGGAHPGNAAPGGAFSPSELLERHTRQSAAAGAPAARTAPVAGQSDPPMPSQAEVESWYRDLRNWGTLGRRRPEGRGQPRHAGEERRGGPPGPQRPQGLDEPGVRAGAALHPQEVRVRTARAPASTISASSTTVRPSRTSTPSVTCGTSTGCGRATIRTSA